ncbi:MAG TPA: hypothetical protein VGL53_21065 [Bryobacteraceae bacterium]
MSSTVREANTLRFLVLLSAILLLFVYALPVQAGGLIQNGSFETTTLASPGGYFCPTGSACTTSNVADWTSTCNNSQCGNGTTPEALLFPGTNGSAWNGGIGLWGTIADSPDGGNYVAVDGDPNYTSTISTSITGLTPNAVYVLSFYQGAAQQKGDNGTTTEQWQVSFSGQTQLSTLMNDASHGVIPWNQQTMTFTAGAANETLSFFAVGTPSGLPPVVLLDGVSLFQAAPEPQSFVLVGIGLVVIPLLIRRRLRPGMQGRRA